MSTITTSGAIPAQSRDEFEQFFQQTIDQGFEPISAEFENLSPDVHSISIYGDLQNSEYRTKFDESADLKSFLIRVENGGLLGYEFQSGLIRISELNRRIESDEFEFPEWKLIYLGGWCIILGFKMVDVFIDQNGLRPVVDEVYRRRWAIMIALMVLAIIK